MAGGATVARLRPAMRDASPWMSPKEAAEYLGVSIDQIYRACASKGLRHSKLGHSTVRFRREWLDDWAEALSVTKGAGRGAANPKA